MAFSIDIDRIEKIIEERELRMSKFFRGESYVPIICHYQRKRAPEKNILCLGNDFDKKIMLENQLSMIEDMLLVNEDYLPFLCPWYGCGVYAEAFGCPTDYYEDKDSWTHPVATNAEEASRLGKPSFEKSPMMKRILETTEFFLEQTKGKIPIALTDTQSPLDTAMIIWEQSSFLTSFYESPDVLHNLLNDITELIIEFSKKQIQLIGKENVFGPGFHMFSQKGGSGLDVSDDILDLLSVQTVEEFDKPYMEKIAAEFDGVAIHSCGNIERHLPVLSKISKLCQLNFKINPSEPNTPEIIRECFKGTGIYLNILIGQGFDPQWDKYGVKNYLEYITEYVLPRLHDKNLKYIINFDVDNKEDAKIFRNKIREKIL